MISMKIMMMTLPPLRGSYLLKNADDAKKIKPNPPTRVFLYAVRMFPPHFSGWIYFWTVQKSSSLNQ